jgi:hypothetical protein
MGMYVSTGRKPLKRKKAKMLKIKTVGNTTVSLENAECVEDGGKYALVCRNHSYLVQDTNKSRLWKHADSVADWCGACAGQDDRYPAEKWEAK